MSKTPYRSEIDGLRGVAVLSVLLYHAGLGIPGGYVGVDIFFVISGFLITGIILRDLDTGHFSIRGFYQRRIRRILPAMTVTLIATLIVGWFLLVPNDYMELGQSTFAQAFMASNIFFYLDSDYFAPLAQSRPLLHTWSLAVEEQFYLFFPVALIAVHRWKPHAIVPSMAILAFMSFVICLWGSYAYPTFNFYLLPTRAWELLIGSMLATITRTIKSAMIRETLSLVGFVCIVAAIFLLDHNTRFPGFATMLPVAGAALVILSNLNDRTIIGRVLSARPLVFVGLISYSLYLVHWPFLVFTRTWFFGRVPLVWMIGVVFGSLLLAALSWKFIETPFRKGRVLEQPNRAFWFAGASVCLLAAIGLQLHRSRGISSRLPDEALRVAEGQERIDFGDYNVSLEQAQAGSFKYLGGSKGPSSTNVLLWGDSHAIALVPVLSALAVEHQVGVTVATAFGTAPLLGFASSGRVSLGADSLRFNQAVLEHVRSSKTRHVVLAAKWGGYMHHGASAALLRDRLSSTIRHLNDAGVKVWVVKQVPVYPTSVENAALFAAWRDRDFDALGLPFAEHVRTASNLDPIFQDLPFPSSALTVLDPADQLLDPLGFYRAVLDGRSLYRDTDHLTVTGSMALKPLFKRMFLESQDAGAVSRRGQTSDQTKDAPSAGPSS